MWFGQSHAQGKRKEMLLMEHMNVFLFRKFLQLVATAQVATASSPTLGTLSSKGQQLAAGNKDPDKELTML